jgi:hypothetical protein
MSDRLGFTASDWRAVPIFEGRCATQDDLEQAGAVFALADTVNGRPVQMAKPSPVIWHAEDEQFAALVVQAEYHETEDEGALEFLGLLLPDGQTVVVFAKDLEFVAAEDPVWESLLQADSPDNDASWPEDDDERPA